MKRLQSDPEWVRQNAAREKVWEERAAAQRTLEKPIVDDLAKAGVRVSSVWDFVNTDKSYARAIPTLIKHLDRADNERVYESLVRALTTGEARGVAGRDLLRHLKMKEPGSEIRWLLANAIAVAIDPSIRDEVALLIENPEFDDVRERLELAVNSMGRYWKRPRS
jgi:hypothetical protein